MLRRPVELIVVLIDRARSARVAVPCRCSRQRRIALAASLETAGQKLTNTAPLLSLAALGRNV
jgi:hypothetical protein